MKQPIALLLLLAVVGCTGSSSGDDDDTGTSPTPDPSVTPTFINDIIPIINSQCGTSDNLCHSRVAYGASSAQDCRGWLSLENASLGAQFYSGANAGDPTGCVDRTLYERLTLAGLSDAWECGPPATNGEAKVPYVVPGNAAASYLYRKINGGPLCAVMPNDPMPPAAPLDSVTIDVIRRWIEAGAPQ